MVAYVVHRKSSRPRQSSALPVYRDSLSGLRASEVRSPSAAKSGTSVHAPEPEGPARSSAVVQPWKRSLPAAALAGSASPNTTAVSTPASAYSPRSPWHRTRYLRRSITFSHPSEDVSFLRVEHVRAAMVAVPRRPAPAALRVETEGAGVRLATPGAPRPPAPARPCLAWRRSARMPEDQAPPIRRASPAPVRRS